MRNLNFALLVAAFLSSANSFALDVEDFKDITTSKITNVQIECEKDGDKLFISTADKKAWQIASGSTNKVDGLDIQVTKMELENCENGLSMNLSLPTLWTDKPLNLEALMSCGSNTLTIRNVDVGTQISMTCKKVNADTARIENSN